MIHIKVKTTPNAKKESLQKEGKNVFIIKVKEPPERNEANLRVRALIAKYFQVPTGKVRIVNGHHRSHKLLSINNT